MKLKTYVPKENLQKSSIVCLHWFSGEEFYTCNDNNELLKWHASTRESMSMVKLPENFTPSDLHCLVLKGKGCEAILIVSEEGRLLIMNKNARVERNVVAHAGAITSSRWGPDGAGLFTAGEDGIVKIWSRSGMLRSTVIQNQSSLKCVRWSPTASAVAFCKDGYIFIKPLAANSKIVKWRAHERLVMSLSWSSSSMLIASGGEDCRYKIWDQQGTCVYSSSPDDYPITSVEFSPDGCHLAVGGFNALRLCHHTGWTYSQTRFFERNVGSLFSIGWSADGTQAAAGTSAGTLVFGHIVETELIMRNLKATTIGRKAIMLEDIFNRTTDTLEFSERIITFALGYSHLVVVTLTQIHIFKENFVNTPIIIDGRADIRILKLAKKHFVVVDQTSIWIYTYNGRLYVTPRFPSSQAQMPYLQSRCISLGLDALAIRDYSNQNNIYLFDLLPGSTRPEDAQTVTIKSAVREVAVCRFGNPDDQYLAVVDVNGDLFVAPIRSSGEFFVNKIGSQVISVKWASDSNILVGLHDSSYSVWYCPGEACNDPAMIALTTTTHDTHEFGRNVSLESFETGYVTFVGEGARFTVAINIFCELLHASLQAGMWEQALRIGRLAQSPVLWATLAAIASTKNQTDISEEAFSAALQIDKVHYLKYIKLLPHGDATQQAENSLLVGRASEAEVILMNNKRVNEAVELLVRLHQWDKALDAATKHNTHIQYVHNERKKYLKALGKVEMNAKYLRSDFSEN